MLLFHHLSPPSSILFKVKKYLWHIVWKSLIKWGTPYKFTCEEWLVVMRYFIEIWMHEKGWRIDQPGHPTLWSPHTSPCWPSSPSWPAPNHIILFKQEILSASQSRFCTFQLSPFSWWLSSTWVHCPWSKARPSCIEQKTWIWGAGSCEEWKLWLLWELECTLEMEEEWEDVDSETETLVPEERKETAEQTEKVLPIKAIAFLLRSLLNSLVA